MRFLKDFIPDKMIYIVQTNNQARIKIGFTSGASVFDRIAQLQTGNPEKIEPVFTADGTIQQEKALHAAMGRLLEWSHLPPAINEWYPGRHPMVKMAIAWFAAHGPVAATQEILRHIDENPRIPKEAHEAFGEMRKRQHRAKKAQKIQDERSRTFKERLDKALDGRPERDCPPTYSVAITYRRPKRLLESNP